ncbi:MAG: nucleotidyltransferase domain-containing protein [Candidatus Schekmanbacteria bacterium]|nr:nucleotidyltransferase domain-containing protein [Candidatus Schekmanbacteria bacterium]
MEIWEITEDKVQAAIKRIVMIIKPVSVILFGSYVRKQIGINSDLDILVVVADSVSNCRREGLRVRRALRGILMPMDIIVVRRSDLHNLADTPGLIYNSALKEGKTVYEKAA